MAGVLASPRIVSRALTPRSTTPIRSVVQPQVYPVSYPPSGSYAVAPQVMHVVAPCLPASQAVAPVVATTAPSIGSVRVSPPAMAMADREKVKQHFDQTVQLARDLMFSDEVESDIQPEPFTQASPSSTPAPPPSRTVPGNASPVMLVRPPVAPVVSQAPAAPVAAQVPRILAPTPPVSPGICMRPVVAVNGAATPQLPLRPAPASVRAPSSDAPVASTGPAEAGSGWSSPRATRLAAMVTVVPPPGHKEPLPTGFGGYRSGVSTPQISPRPSPGAATPRGVLRPAVPGTACINVGTGTPPVMAPWAKAPAVASTSVAGTPGPPIPRFMSAPHTSSPLPVKVVTVRRMPAAGVVLPPDASHEVDLDSPSQTTTSPVKAASSVSPARPARASRVSSPSMGTRRESSEHSGAGSKLLELEERFRELERRFMAKDAECQQAIDSLREEKERSSQNIAKRDSHIAELSRRNKELMQANRAEPEVARATNDSSDSNECMEATLNPSSCERFSADDGSNFSAPLRAAAPAPGDTAGAVAAAAADAAVAAAAVAAAARGGGRFSDRSSAKGHLPKANADGRVFEDTPTLACLRERLTAKSTRGRNHIASTPSTGGESQFSETSSRGPGRQTPSGRQTPTRLSGTRNTFGKAPARSEQRTPPRGRN
eukprot:TRINITY_DN39194_c0_g1_i1.p1 TRINITY_DN39194_c0_g1~~TRINITY_DN39194_c0_g1_i1.p1  ORF type:complete len:691 (+),score=90.00 TRINITY_DN39194_c0_g1_i1:102-2075(+)